MIYELDQQQYPVLIERKNNKNSYIRVKEDKTIYVTTSYFVTNAQVKVMLDQNQEYLRRVMKRRETLQKREEKFFYLGKNYDIIVVSDMKQVKMEDSYIYVRDQKMLERFLKKECLRLFTSRLQTIWNLFTEEIPYPVLKIRSMKTRWGVCNKKNQTITLNSRLIEYTIEYIDYVIVHELSHFVHFNHSKEFWNTVEKYCPNYKILRKGLKE